MKLILKCLMVILKLTCNFTILLQLELTIHSLDIKNFNYLYWLARYKDVHITFTTRNLKVAECCMLCRVQSLGHSANDSFAECHAKNTQQTNCTRQKNYLPSAKKKHLAKNFFAECKKKDTRQRTSLPSVKKKTLDKYNF